MSKNDAFFSSLLTKYLGKIPKDKLVFSRSLVEDIQKTVEKISKEEIKEMTLQEYLRMLEKSISELVILLTEMNDLLSLEKDCRQKERILEIKKKMESLMIDYHESSYLPNLVKMMAAIFTGEMDIEQGKYVFSCFYSDIRRVNEQVRIFMKLMEKIETYEYLVEMLNRYEQKKSVVMSQLFFFKQFLEKMEPKQYTWKVELLSIVSKVLKKEMERKEAIEYCNRELMVMKAV